MRRRTSKGMKKHWYKQFIGECPVCGKDQSYRVRVYGKKPKDREKVYFYLSQFYTYDGCLEGYF